MGKRPELARQSLIPHPVNVVAALSTGASRNFAALHSNWPASPNMCGLHQSVVEGSGLLVLLRRSRGLSHPLLRNRKSAAD
jgi:hypothetical protein